jgi:pimeloyl-ACP methyl ester carboxylesterase
MKVAVISVRKLLLILILTLLVVACQDTTPEPVDSVPATATTAVVAEEPTAEPPTATPTEQPTATPESTDTPVPDPVPTDVPVEESEPVSAEPFDVSIPAADGLELIGTLYPAQGESPAPAVMLLHMLGGRRGDWGTFANDLSTSGYTVLALDMRGHGATGGAQDWAATDDDLLRAWQFLAEQDGVDGERTAVIGASIGSNMALRTASAESTIKTVVLLSPGLDYRGVTTEEAMVVFGDRPAFIVAANGDTYSAESSATLADLATNAQLQLYDDASHGTRMFPVHEALDDLIINWLDTQLQ